MKVIEIIGSHSPMLHNCNAPESLIDADISVTPRNLDAKFTPLSPSLLFTITINKDAIEK